MTEPFSPAAAWVFDSRRDEEVFLRQAILTSLRLREIPAAGDPVAP